MANEIFCCTSIRPYKAIRTAHEAKFTAFKTASEHTDSIRRTNEPEAAPAFLMQAAEQVNYGDVLSKRYFLCSAAGEWSEVAERAVHDLELCKVSSYKNYKCAEHDRFYEVNLYIHKPGVQAPQNVNEQRPASSIDL